MHAAPYTRGAFYGTTIFPSALPFNSILLEATDESSSSNDNTVSVTTSKIKRDRFNFALPFNRFVRDATNESRYSLSVAIVICDTGPITHKPKSLTIVIFDRN
jgi:hypothetical protein